MGFPRLAILLCWASLVSCEQTALRGGSEKANSVAHETKDAKEAAAEKVDPPNNISGTYLHCVTEIEPSDAKPEALIGCRLDDAAGKRVLPTQVAAEVTYTHRASNNPDFQVYAKQLAGDARYDAAYLFFGPTRGALLNTIQNTEVLVQLKAEKATGSDFLLGDRIRDIARDKNTIPEAPNSDYNQVRDAILIEAQQGQVTPPLP